MGEGGAGQGNGGTRAKCVCPPIRCVCVCVCVHVCVSGGPVGSAGGCEAGGWGSLNPSASPFAVGAGGLR